MNDTRPADLRELLVRLDLVLDEERDALRVLNSRAVERLTGEKLKIDAEIRNAIGRGVVCSDQALMERVRRKAQDNQILLVHARNCIRSALETITGGHQGSYDSNRPPPPKAVRFDLKG